MSRIWNDEWLGRDQRGVSRSRDRRRHEERCDHSGIVRELHSDKYRQRVKPDGRRVETEDEAVRLALEEWRGWDE